MRESVLKLAIQYHGNDRKSNCGPPGYCPLTCHASDHISLAHQQEALPEFFYNSILFTIRRWKALISLGLFNGTRLWRRGLLTCYGGFVALMLLSSCSKKY